MGNKPWKQKLSSVFDIIGEILAVVYVLVFALLLIDAQWPFLQNVGWLYNTFKVIWMYGGFVIADIPGLIEGASEGVGLGLDFLRHIERTNVIIHVLDASGIEGRDPVEDIRAINHELEQYDPKLLSRPQVIAANKIDAIYMDGDDPVSRLKAEFEPKGIRVFPISAVSGKGLKELLYYVQELLNEMPKERLVFEQEFFPEDALMVENLPYTVEQDEKNPHVFIVEGPKIEKMLGYTNLDSEKGFAFFQRFLKDTGILDELEQAGIQEGDTVRMYGLEFDYYK